MPQNETVEEDLDEDIDENEDDLEDAENDPNLASGPDPVEALAAVSEEIKTHHARLGAVAPQLLAALGPAEQDTPVAAVARFVLLELSETVLGLFADMSEASTESLVQMREWADQEIEPRLEELEDDVDSGAAAGVDDDEVIVPLPVVEKSVEHLGSLRTMIEKAMETAATPEQKAQLAAMREEVDKTVAGLAEALPEDDTDEPEAPATPES